ncbi:MAG: isochorismate synthase MenF [Halodesulfurarchaeum sp.]
MAPGKESAAGLDAPFRTRVRRLDPIPLAVAMEVLPEPLGVWTGPDEATIVASGERRTLTAGGAERIQAIRRQARPLFDSVETVEPSQARPRLFGGISFHPRTHLRPPWEAFSPASFVLPALQLVQDDTEAWLTAIADPNATDSPGLETLASRLVTASPETTSRPGISQTRFSVGEERWRQHVADLTASIASVETVADPGNRAEETGTADTSAESTGADAKDEEISGPPIAESIDKVVLAQALEVTLQRPFAPQPVLSALSETYPDCFRFAVSRPSASQRPERDRERATFFGASPERLVSKRGRRVSTTALAGTVERGETSDEDQVLSSTLQTDPKIEREHGVVVERIEGQLSSIGTDVTVGNTEVRRLDAVQHLETPLSATAPEGGHVLDIVEALHPTPAVGGLPPGPAMEAIEEREPVDRGWYAGPVGWFDADGDGTFAVGIRSAVATGDRATLFAGNGIVADSDPADEWDEVRLKFRPVLDHLD